MHGMAVEKLGLTNLERPRIGLGQCARRPALLVSEKNDPSTLAAAEVIVWRTACRTVIITESPEGISRAILVDPGLQ
jgi:hypothetical protein